MFKENARKDLIAPVVLGVIFALSRVLYDRAGISFDSAAITRTWHFIDIELLKNDLWRSIFYLHTQPPLMNLFTGIGIQLFPGSYTSVFHAVALLGGLLLMLGIYFLGRRLGLHASLAMILATWFAVSPATVLYENYAFYAYPTLISLVLSAVFLARFLENKRALDGILYSLALAINALTWSLFHLFWMIGCIAIAAFVLKGNRRKVLWLLPALILVFAWYAKNGVLYNSFTGSTWAGLNVFKSVTVRLPDGERKGLVWEGVISNLALVPPFRSPDVYLKYFPETPTTGVPLLDEINISSGYRNQHHLSYVYAGEQYMADAVRIFMHAPQYYLRTIPSSIYIFFHSASDYEHLWNREAVVEFDLWWNRIFYGQWEKEETLRERSYSFSSAHLGWWLLIGFLFVIAAAPIYLWRNRTHPFNLEYGLILFIFWNIVFVTAAGLLFDIGENNRTRFAIDPFLLLLFVFFVKELHQKAVKSKLPNHVE